MRDAQLGFVFQMVFVLFCFFHNWKSNDDGEVCDVCSFEILDLL